MWSSPWEPLIELMISRPFEAAASDELDAQQLERFADYMQWLLADPAHWKRSPEALLNGNARRALAEMKRQLTLKKASFPARDADGKRLYW